MEILVLLILLGGAIMGLIYLFIAGVRFLARGVAGATSSALEGLGVSKDTARTVGCIVGGVTAGMIAREVVTDVCDLANDTVAMAHDTGNYYTQNDPLQPINPNQNYIDGYYRQDGTFVHGHMRTMPNATIGDNISAHK